jgi:glutaredoxin 3
LKSLAPDPGMSTPKIVMYVMDACPYCSRARRLFAAKGVAVEEIDIEMSPELRAEMLARSGRRTVPQIFIGDLHIGGSEELAERDASGALDALLHPQE